MAVVLFLAVVFGAAFSAGGAEKARSGPGDISDPVRAVKLYIVVNGQMQTRLLRPADFSEKTRFEIEGYVSGIAVIAAKPLTVRVAGQQLSPAVPDAEGKCSFGYYGDIRPAQFADDEKIQGYGGRVPRYPAEKKILPPVVYACFPQVPADTVSRRPEFDIGFHGRQKDRRLTVSHSRTRACPPPENTRRTSPERRYRYAGPKTAINTADRQADKNRMEAIAGGIASVEAAFGVDIVSGVDILAYQGIHNAVTRAGEDRIWFYINAFKNEPVDELTVIAEHEALHLLVDRLGLARKGAIRRLFADLKGFDAFSKARFRLLTTGVVRADDRMKTGENGFFFEFVSEKNFLNGMKGGHPQADPDEFCTSFLHTLMYTDRFAANLNRLLTGGGGRTGRIQMAQRRFVLDTYLTLLRIVGRAFDAGCEKAGGQGKRPACARRLIENSISEVRAIASGGNRTTKF
ncbi:MAG: hypothetical protein ACQERN_08135 [Thermodesulfobacteriota bacterium]